MLLKNGVSTLVFLMAVFSLSSECMESSTKTASSSPFFPSITNVYEGRVYTRGSEVTEVGALFSEYMEGST